MRMAISVCLLAAAATAPCVAGPVHVVVMAGQSNMTSGGHLEDLPTEPVDLTAAQNDILYHYSIAASEQGVAAEWQSLSHLKGTVKGSTYASELTFARSVANRWPQQQWAIVKVAGNGTNLHTDWLPGETNGRWYQRMIDHVAVAVGQLEDQGHDVKMSGFVWVQGSGDAYNIEKGSAYEENLELLIASVRDQWHVQGLPVLFNQFHINADRSADGIAAIRHSQAQVAANDPRAAMVNIDDLPLKADRIHFPSETHMELGYRFADAFSALSVPEPSTGWLAAAGALLLAAGAVFRRRWRNLRSWAALSA